MGFSFVHQNEHPSWGTQFGRSILQMLAQGVIGGGTNLLQNVIMQGIRSRDQNALVDKQLGASQAAQQAMRQNRLDVKGMELGAKDMMNQDTIAAANARNQANVDQRTFKPTADLFRAAGQGGEAAGLEMDKQRWAPQGMRQAADAGARAGQGFMGQLVGGGPASAIADMAAPELGRQTVTDPTQTPKRIEDFWQSIPQAQRDKAEMSASERGARAAGVNNAEKHGYRVQEAYLLALLRDKAAAAAFSNKISAIEHAAQIGDTARAVSMATDPDVAIFFPNVTRETLYDQIQNLKTRINRPDPVRAFGQPRQGPGAVVNDSSKLP